MTSTLTRTLRNQPANEEHLRNTPLRIDCEVYESPIRGITYDREEIEHEHRTSYPLMPIEAFKRVMVRHGAILVDEVV